MDPVDRRTLIAGASLLGAAALARRARAGDLNPPPGPVAPTGRTLKEIEPRTPIQSLPGTPDYMFVISQPGSYFLAGDIAVPPNMRAILVNVPAGDVSIDMEGFAIRGNSGGLGALTASTPGPDYIEISDGWVANFTGDGIDSGGARMIECYDLHINHCARGIVVRTSGIVESCSVERCTSDGIAWARAAVTEPTVFLVDDCDCRACGQHGIAITGDWSSGDSTFSITACDCVGNAGDGIHFLAMAQGAGGTVGGAMCDCTCARNAGHGTRGSNASAAGTTGARCSLQLDSLVCAGNGVSGMRLFNLHADVMDCDCCDNASDGIVLDTCNGSADGCTTSRNTAVGLHLTGPSRISVCDCSSISNRMEGIALDAACSGCAVTECDSQGNGGGYRIDNPANLLLWNTASGNSANYVLSPAMPVVVVNATDIPTNTSPHANYSL